MGRYINTYLELKDLDINVDPSYLCYYKINRTSNTLGVNIDIGRITKIGRILVIANGTNELKLPWWASIFKITSPFIYKLLKYLSNKSFYGAFGALPETILLSNSESFKSKHLSCCISPFQQQTGMVEAGPFALEDSKNNDFTKMRFNQRPYTELTIYIYPAQIVTTAENQPETTNS